jgi:hypothetical protein
MLVVVAYAELRVPGQNARSSIVKIFGFVARLTRFAELESLRELEASPSRAQLVDKPAGNVRTFVYRVTRADAVVAVGNSQRNALRQLTAHEQDWRQGLATFDFAQVRSNMKIVFWEQLESRRPQHILSLEVLYFSGAQSCCGSPGGSLWIAVGKHVLADQPPIIGSKHR